MEFTIPEALPPATHRPSVDLSIIARAGVLADPLSKSKPSTEAPQLPQEEHFERTLRPLHLSEYRGQQRATDQLSVFVQAAQQRREPLDHTLIFGPPGLGKTTLASIIAREMSGQMHATSGPVLEKGGDLAAVLTHLEPGSVLFIDEIHRLNPQIEELLYPAMEDYRLDIVIGEGPSARSIKLDLHPFTLIGATTRAGSLTAPLRDRFGITLRLEYYAVEDLEGIVGRAAGLLGYDLEVDGAREIARRSRGTPRIANRLLRRARDVAEVRAGGVINAAVAAEALDLLEVDGRGLDAQDRRYLQVLIGHFRGGPVGISSLAIAVGEDKGTLEEIVEPYLIQQGLLVRSAQGRCATPAAVQCLGLEMGELGATLGSAQE